MAGPLAPHVRGGRVGLSPLWRSHARGRHHRGPCRHSEDSHPPRAPDRGARASSTAVRPVRLELTSSAGAVCCAPRAHGASAGRVGRLLTPGWPPYSGLRSHRGTARPPLAARLYAASLRTGGGWVDATREWLVGDEGRRPPSSPLSSAMIADEDVHRHAVDNINQADALLLGRVTYEMMEAAWRLSTRTVAMPEWTERFARTIGKEAYRVEHPEAGRLERGARARRSGEGRSAAQAGVG